MTLPKAAHTALFLVSIVLHVMLAYVVQRPETVLLLSSFFVLGGIFLVQWADQKISTPQLIAAGMLLRLVYLLAMPALSEDAFRYLWDGHLSLQGISPYAFAPQANPQAGHLELYEMLNSKPYHSIYPPVLQGLFALAAKFGGESIWGGIVALRILVLLAEAATMLLVAKLLSIWNLNGRNLMLYAFNPLVIVEFAGNLHGEVFMLPLLLVALLLLSLQRWQRAVLPFAGAVGVKLLPLMFLPFLPKRLGWARAVVFGAGTLALVGAMYFPFYTETLLPDTLQTLRLYFASFEFNGSIYYGIRSIGFWWKGYNIIGLTAVWLPRAVALIILTIAWRQRHKSMATLPQQWMWAWVVYYLFATTVNPWYVAVLAVFLPFVRYRFGMVWLLLIPLSYHAYGADGVHENLWVVAAQYLPVMLWMGLELGAFITIEQRWALRKAEVKRLRLAPLLHQKETVLEVGSGNGALTILLRNEGHGVTPLDIANRSIFPEVMPVVYDVDKFPFADKAFSTCQLITMLHHTPHPEQLIQEAMRVANRIIIMEDIYANSFQKGLTMAVDSLVNWEFYGHPHTNRSDAQWQETFVRLGLRLQWKEEYRFLGVFKQITYVLVPNA